MLHRSTQPPRRDMHRFRVRSFAASRESIR
jgi:hypothetical protein